VPRLWRSHGRGVMTQPFRAGLTFSGRPSGPRWVWSKSQSFHLNGAALALELRLSSMKGMGLSPYIHLNKTTGFKARPLQSEKSYPRG
jgi:hypothetical protein